MDITIGGFPFPSAGENARNEGFVQNSNNANVDRRAVGTRAAQNGLNGQGQNGTAQPATGATNEDSLELSPEARRMLESLQARDKAVRAHEAAHVAAGAGIVNGGAQFTMQRGPDGNMYAVGGEVSVDASEVPNDPEATIAKARQIAAAALAPSDPSPQDRAVAANARQMEVKATSESARNTTETSERNTAETSEPDEPNSPSGANNLDDADGANVQELTDRGRQAVNAYGMAATPQGTASNPVANAYQAVA